MTILNPPTPGRPDHPDFKRLVDDRWEYCKDLHPRNKWKQEHCYIEGFNHGTAKKN